jgi:hypothetical protein
MAQCVYEDLGDHGISNEVIRSRLHVTIHRLIAVLEKSPLFISAVYTHCSHKTQYT